MVAAGWVVLVVADVVGHLRVECRLSTLLVNAASIPSGPTNSTPSPRALSTISCPKLLLVDLTCRGLGRLGHHWSFLPNALGRRVGAICTVRLDTAGD